jgi:serine protease Do
MVRVGLALTLLCVASLLLFGVRAQERQPMKEVEVIEEAMQRAIRETEPAIACILVSHSDAYRKIFHDEPSPEYEGKLGGFSVSKPLPAAGKPIVPQDNRRLIDEFFKYDLGNPNNVPESYGSGVVIDGDKLLVLTNYHVVRGATKVFVRLPGDKGSYADIYAADPLSDLAVLKLLNERIRPLKEIRWGDGGAVRKGQFILSVSNPFAAGFRDGSPSASWGIVSNIRQRAPRPVGDEDPRTPLPLAARATLLQTDAKLSLGCSGGALLNLRGEMIGLTTSKAALTGSETAGGFALPIDANIKRIIDKLRQGMEVEYGFLGIQPGQSDPAARKGGVVISQVVPGSPANKAGLQPMEEILSINGTPVHDPEEVSTTIGLLLAGSEARVEVRDRPKPVVVKLVKTSIPGKVIASNKAPLVRGFRVDYTSVLFTRSPRTFGVDIQPGVYVRDIQSGSRAEAAGLRLNDIITEVNGQEVDTPTEFYKEVQKAATTAPLVLTLAVSDWHRTSTTKVTIP